MVILHMIIESLRETIFFTVNPIFDLATAQIASRALVKFLVSALCYFKKNWKTFLDEVW